MRFRCCSAVLLALASVSGAARAADTAVTLTLDQAFGSVEGANVNVLLGREAAAQALELSNQVRSGVLPNIGLNAQQRRTQSVNIVNGSPVISGPGNRFDGKFTGNYNLLNFQQLAALKAARAGVDVAQADYKAIVQSVLANVAQVYFTHLRDLKRIEVLDANIARAQSLYELASNQLSAGVATQIDVTRAEAQLEVSKQARLQQDTVVYQSELLLKRLLDLPPSGAMTLADFTVRRADGNTITIGDERTTFEQRADWVRSQKAVDQSKLDVRTAKFERLPALSVGGEYGYAAGNYDDSGKTAWFAGATLSMPLFDGLRSDADRRAALSRQRSQELRLHNLELQISSELRLARQDAASRNAQITVAEKNLRLAEEELRLAQQRYRQGVADNREVVEAQNRLAIAADNYVDAVYQYNLSRVELARSKGDVRTILTEKQ